MLALGAAFAFCFGACIAPVVFAPFVRWNPRAATWRILIPSMLILNWIAIAVCAFRLAAATDWSKGGRRLLGLLLCCLRWVCSRYWPSTRGRTPFLSNRTCTSAHLDLDDAKLHDRRSSNARNAAISSQGYRPTVVRNAECIENLRSRTRTSNPDRRTFHRVGLPVVVIQVILQCRDLPVAEAQRFD